MPVPSTRRTTLAALAALVAAPLAGGLASAAAADAAALAPAPAAQRPPARYVVLQGADTILVESVAHTPDSLRGTMTVGNQARVAYEASLAPDARIATLALAITPPGATSPASRAEARFVGDSIFAVQMQGPTVDSVRRGTQEGALPYLNPSVGFVEQIVRRARAMRSTTAEVPIYVIGPNPATVPATVTQIVGDSVLVSMGGVEFRLAVRPDGTFGGGVIPAQSVTIVRAN